MPAGANMSGSGSGARAGATVVLVTLAAGQFLMTLDTSVMNVAIATVADDVGTDVTGVQTGSLGRRPPAVSWRRESGPLRLHQPPRRRRRRPAERPP
jgi:hypothetical protein